ncbi:MAG TPA: WYL domain-containing protein [Desulfobacteraceae bacterium]|nr:WYL domain-containing protein [Desulfobacteraceae bacterium]
MPAKIHHAIARQWELLKLLPNRLPGKSALELAAALDERGYKVSKRTVERDLNELILLFPLACNDRGTPFGWYWMPETYCELPGLTLAEAMTTRLLEDYLKPLLPTSILRTLAPRFKHAADKLAFQKESHLSTWTDKVRVVPAGLTLLPPEIDPLVLETVQEALLKDKQLEIQYRAAQRKQASTQTIHPLGLVQRGPVGYLVATAFDYEDVRLYALHRITAAIPNKQQCRRPRGFNLDDYIKTGALEFGDGKFIRLRASISPELANILRETPLTKDIQIKERRHDCLLTCTIVESWQLYWWILSQGAEIEILAPKKLRQAVMDGIKRAAEIYA